MRTDGVVPPFMCSCQKKFIYSSVRIQTYKILIQIRELARLLFKL